MQVLLRNSKKQIMQTQKQWANIQALTATEGVLLQLLYQTCVKKSLTFKKYKLIPRSFYSNLRRNIIFTWWPLAYSLVYIYIAMGAVCCGTFISAQVMSDPADQTNYT